MPLTCQVQLQGARGSATHQGQSGHHNIGDIGVCRVTAKLEPASRGNSGGHPESDRCPHRGPLTGRHSHAAQEGLLVFAQTLVVLVQLLDLLNALLGRGL